MSEKEFLSREARFEEILSRFKNAKELRDEIKKNMTTRKKINPGSCYPLTKGYSTATRRPVRDMIKYIDELESVLLLLIEEIYFDFT